MKIITVLWEDQRGGIIKGFGPHELLVACVADELQRARGAVKKCIVSVPKKGYGKVINALQSERERLRNLGPVCAVFDLDKIHKLWPAGQRPPMCMSGIRAAVAGRAPGIYELVLLDKNMETIVNACCRATGRVEPSTKPTPDERDRILGKVASDSGADARRHVRDSVPSFDRLARWVARHVPAPSPE